jgi:hypothetical protein
MWDVEHHGSESYFVLGEGLLGESGGGRARGSSARVEAQAPPFRFSRLGPKGRQLGEATRRKLGEAMSSGGGGESSVPAGFTYLGQFIDHDLTFDKTKVMLGEAVSPAELLQARSPSLDLDSLYGAGPAEPRSAKFYLDDRHLRTGRTAAIGGDEARDGFDLPRGDGTTAAAKRKAVIPDFRNDENLAVAQTHAAFIRFHNRVVDTLPASTPAAQRFHLARELVVKHYQWMIRHDYLPRICDAAVVTDVFKNGRKIFEVGAAPTDVPTMPIEFSVAAFRFGHAMVRSAYNWNARFPNGQGTLDLLFTFSGTSGDLGGSQRLTSNWIADWRRLYNFGQANRDDLTVPGSQFNRAMRIDTTLVNPLKNLRPASFGGPDAPANDPSRNLAFRNLTRASMVQLATGQQMVAMLKSRGVPVTALTKDQLRDGNRGATLDALTASQRQAVLEHTPLWFYTLREAEFNRGKLTGVGARILAETVHRAMEGSRHSIVRDPTWQPSFGPDSKTFRMVHLLVFAFEGKKALVNPLG